MSPIRGKKMNESFTNNSARLFKCMRISKSKRLIRFFNSKNYDISWGKKQEKNWPDGRLWFYICIEIYGFWRHFVVACIFCIASKRAYTDIRVIRTKIISNNIRFAACSVVCLVTQKVNDNVFFLVNSRLVSDYNEVFKFKLLIMFLYTHVIICTSLLIYLARLVEYFFFIHY